MVNLKTYFLYANRNILLVLTIEMSTSEKLESLLESVQIFIKKMKVIKNILRLY